MSVYVGSDYKTQEFSPHLQVETRSMKLKLGLKVEEIATGNDTTFGLC